jgi:hypothetical protein
VNRWISVAAALCVTIGCSSSPAEVASRPAAAEEFVGSWRSVTPPLEFVRLSVHSLSVEMGALGARLTFSGVAWEGGGRIDGDSLVISGTMAGTAVPTGVMVLRAIDAQTLRLQVRSGTADALDLTLVREDGSI